MSMNGSIVFVILSTEGCVNIDMFRARAVTDVAISDVDEIKDADDRNLVKNILVSIENYKINHKASSISIEDIRVNQCNEAYIEVNLSNMASCLGYGLLSVIFENDIVHVMDVIMSPSTEPTSEATHKVTTISSRSNQSYFYETDNKMQMKILVLRRTWAKSTTESMVETLRCSISPHPSARSGDDVDVDQMARYALIDRETKQKLLRNVDVNDKPIVYNICCYLYAVYKDERPILMTKITDKKDQYEVVCHGFFEIHTSWIDQMLSRYNSRITALRFMGAEMEVPDIDGGDDESSTYHSQNVISICFQVRKHTTEIKNVYQFVGEKRGRGASLDNDDVELPAKRGTNGVKC